MILTVLGSGTSTGVPMIGCSCATCRSRNPRNQRTRASVWIQTRNKSFLIDTSTDFRQQALREKIGRVDFILYTHPHADHVSGIDELRSYNFLQKSPIPVYANAWTCQELTLRYPYIFKPSGVAEGGGIPLISLNEIPARAESLEIQGVPVVPVSVLHGSKEVLAYRIDSVAYVTDTSYIPPESLDRLKGLSVLVLDCLRLRAHRTHFHLDQALDVVSQIRPKRTFLTHLGHDFDYVQSSKKLPKGVALAYDGLVIRS